MRIICLVENIQGAAGCGAAHGLSLFVETPKHRLLMDTGPSGLLVENARALGVDLSAVDAVVISHGHYDHADGLPAFAQVNPSAPVYIRSGADGALYSSAETLHYIGMDPAALSLPQLRWLTADTRIDDELFLFGGVRGRRAWPEGNRSILRRLSDGMVQDTFDHEQSLVVTEGQRHALLCGCAHSGILNILDRYHALLGDWPDAVIGGFHMKQPGAHTEAQIQTIETTARALLALPCMYYTCHCTGLPAFEIMKGLMDDRLQYLHCGDAITV